MAKQTINVGRTPNDKSGDSLRVAFQKVNANFSELYAGGLGGGSIAGLTSNGTDTITLNSGYKLIPETNSLQDLGTPSHQWRSLYVSNNTIYLNNIPVSIDNNTLVVGTGGSQNTVATETYVDTAIAGIPAGPKGDPGEPGAKGEPGDPGPKGDKGDTGDRGLQGLQGIPGNQGIQGIQGVKGDKGDQGNPGIQGIQGIQGNPGAQGAQGPKGDKGDQGNTGLKGDQGIQGNDGPQGIQGIRGLQGVSVTLQGTKTLIADLPAAPVNPNDFAGHGWIVTEGGGDLWFWNLTDQAWNNVGPIVGPEGPQGAQGIPGVKGDQGEPGVQGEQGLQGVPGEQGIQGVKGDKGDQGEPGVQGEQGLQGVPGEQGAQGNPGPKGDQGEPGPPGDPGPKGDKGDQGDPASTGDFRFNNNYLYTDAGQSMYIDPSNDEGDTGYITIPGPADANTSPLVVANQMDGGVQVSAVNNNWTFDNTGKLTLPQGSRVIELGEGMVELTAGAGDNSYASLASFDSNSYMWVDNTAAYIGTDWTGNTNRWIFGTDAILTLPNGGKVGPIQFAGGVELFTDDTETGYVQLNYNNENFIWTDSTGNSIQTGDKIWAFSTDGTFNLPESISAGNAIIQTTSNINLQVNSNGKIWQFGTSGNLTLPAGGDILDSNGVSVLGGGTTLPSDAAGYLYNDGEGVLSWTQNIDATGNLTVDLNHFIGFAGEDPNWGVGYRHASYTKETVYGSIDQVVGSGSWENGDDGYTVGTTNGVSLFELNGHTQNAWFRNNLTVNGGTIVLEGIGTVKQEFGSVNIVAGGPGFAQLQWTTPSGAAEADPNGTEELLNWIYVESDGAYIETNVNGEGGFNRWYFSIDGGLAFPDNTIQTTAWTGSFNPVVVSDTAPETEKLWFNSQEARMYVKYNEQWVDASPTVLAPPDTNPTLESVTFNDNTVQTTAWPGTFSYNDLTDKPETPTFVGGGGASTWLTAD